MNILVAHNNFTVPGGEETYISLLVNALKGHGHTVIPYIKNSSSIRLDFSSKIQQGLNAFYGKTTEKEVRTLIKKYKPDIVHIGNLYPLITPALISLCASLQIPIVYSVLDHRLVCPAGTLFRAGKPCTLCVGKMLPYFALLYSCYHHSRPATSFLVATELKHRINKYLSSVDHFLFSSCYSQDMIIPAIGIPKEKTTILPYFTKMPADRPAKSPYPFPYFLFVGRLSPEKGIIKLLQLFEKMPSIHLVVVGDGPLRKQVNEYKKNKNIHILGHVKETEKADIISYAKATIIPSSPLYEVGPYALIESYSQGTPVIAPQSGVFLERLVDTVSGFFYSPDDFLDLKKKVLLVNALPADRHRLLRSGSKNLYTERHTPIRFYTTLMKVYSKVLKKKPK